MSEQVWKFEIWGGRVSDFDMPKGAQILHVDVHGDSPCMWALVDTEAKTERRSFVVAVTGHSLPNVTKAYVGTFQLFGGKVVFHVFEVTDNG